ncbi:UBX domain-containing protein 8 isoform X4 [Ochotona princeps]|uniref:UBX domain-containing protein 8 isoform X4 n=1 Tax=Ochotona princeps TaxID=9978 RepID=UPI00271509CE|nr:UBX domain-containing protein 8 isoform X4 [Ochotona princeps]
MASRGVLGIFILSALPILWLELRRGIPGLEEEENEKRQKFVRKQQQEAQGEKGDEDLVLDNASHTSSETPGREAARRRNLCEPLRTVPPPAAPQPQEEVPDLPEEPSATAEEVVTVALRCPSGSVLRRRFLKSCSAQVLLDWMVRVGYHTSLYGLSTSFPRKSLEVVGGWSLEDAGISTDTMLNVEEKEQSN